MSFTKNVTTQITISFSSYEEHKQEIREWRNQLQIAPDTGRLQHLG